MITSVFGFNINSVIGFNAIAPSDEDKLTVNDLYVLHVIAYNYRYLDKIDGGFVFLSPKKLTKEVPLLNIDEKGMRRILKKLWRFCLIEVNVLNTHRPTAFNYLKLGSRFHEIIAESLLGTDV